VSNASLREAWCDEATPRAVGGHFVSLSVSATPNDVRELPCRDTCMSITLAPFGRRARCGPASVSRLPTSWTAEKEV
jgi:hypothetical protein